MRQNCSSATNRFTHFPKCLQVDGSVCVRKWHFHATDCDQYHRRNWSDEVIDKVLRRQRRRNTMLIARNTPMASNGIDNQNTRFHFNDWMTHDALHFRCRPTAINIVVGWFAGHSFDSTYFDRTEVRRPTKWRFLFRTKKVKTNMTLCVVTLLVLACAASISVSEYHSFHLSFACVN